MPIPIHCAHDEVVAIGKLKPNPRNPNTHSPEQIALLAKIIKAQGWRNPIVVSNRSGFITKGHARLTAATALGCKVVPVDRQDYGSEKEEVADMIADNRIAELAEADRAMLRELAEELDDGAFDMDLTGFDNAALEELMTAAPPANDIDAEPQIDKAEELRKKWGVERGQIWELGEHRLMCGDSTEKCDVEALLAQEKPNLMVTDPPYGVDYDPEWRNATNFKANRATGIVRNDDRSDWTPAWKLFAGNVAYVWHGGLHGSEVQQSLQASGFVLRAQIIWSKQNQVFSRGDYHWKHEPCFYIVRKGKVGRWCGDRKQVTVWEIQNHNPMGGNRTEESTGHSAQKPVECMSRPIRNHASTEVYDPFVGSGTTIIACEQLGRKCRAMEIDPGYVAVSIQRWVDATGKTPKVLNG